VHGDRVAGGQLELQRRSDVDRTFSIAKAAQTIDFAALDDKTYGDPDFDVFATASSGLAVTFSTSGDCQLVFGKVDLTGAGSCTVTAHQVGGDNYNAASDVNRTFSIAKAAQSIAFLTIGDNTFGSADFEIAPTAGSGLTVSLDASGRLHAELADLARERAHDRRRLLHDHGVAGRKRQLQPRFGCHALVLDREGEPDDHVRGSGGPHLR
jgi:hypothetical protein